MLNCTTKETQRSCVTQKDKDNLVIPQKGEQLVSIYKTKHKLGQKKVVVDREDSNLTTEDVKKHWPEVAAAIQKVLGF